MAGNHAADAADGLRHPNPLNARGVGWGMHEHPADGPAHESLPPRRGAVCLSEGTGTLSHVDHLTLAKGWSAGLRTPAKRSFGHWPPLDLLKVEVLGARVIFDQRRRHPTAPVMLRVPLGLTCRWRPHADHSSDLLECGGVVAGEHGFGAGSLGSRNALIPR